jgi:two-component system, chemotaxis family, chemotaxis protein CheY
MKALVVDDSRGMRMIVRRVMEELGFEVVEASDGKEAIDRLRSDGPFRVALVDWNMPNMNGLELLRAMRAEKAFRETTVMMVTTESEQHRVVAALAAGADEYLMKPFTKDDLAAKLEILGLVPGGAR